MSGPLWDYAVALYGRPGVQAACLALQERRGADVNLLLLACWLGAGGRHPDAAALAEAEAAAAAWQAQIVRPLRAVRRQVKAAATGLEAALRPEAEEIRRRTAALELDAERIELTMLERTSPRNAATGGPGDARLAAALIGRLANVTQADEGEIATLLGQAFPALGENELAGLARLAWNHGREHRWAGPSQKGPVS